jgi:bifunctional ADP-heptose synthase (sugar kinase/adenylyltransferase)
MRLIENFLKDAGKLSVLVVGETITDEFIKVEYQGQSMKSFCPVFRLQDLPAEQQLGGSYAIYRHLKDFVGKIELIANEPAEIVKTRYIDVNSGEKHLEFNKFDLKKRTGINIDVNKYDVVILADFGHGFCEHIKISDGFHLMCQTNSHNFGFNRISKWKSNKKKSICIDLREASLQINHRIADCTDEIMIELYNYELDTEQLFVTTGKQGSIYTNGKQILRQPSFKTEIVDTIGAGDAYFGFSALCSTLNMPDQQKLIIPSLAASLTTTWLCNEKNVTPENLLSHANKHLQ